MHIPGGLALSIKCVGILFLHSHVFIFGQLGLGCFMHAFSCCSEQGLVFMELRRLLTMAACLVKRRLQACRLQQLQLQDTWVSLVVTHRLGSCGSRAQECRLGSCGSLGFVALQRVGSFPARGQTCVPCPDRWILIHYATREVRVSILEKLQHNSESRGVKIDSTT